MKNKKYSTMGKLIKGLDLPETAIPDCSSIEMIGDRRVVIEQIKSILEYENNCVRIDVGKYFVVISGAELTLDSFEDNIIVVDGKIKSICLE